MKAKKIVHFGFIASLLMLCMSCSNSRSFTKKGEKLLKGGLYEEAAQYYYLALQKNSNNVEAKIALKENAQKVLDDKLANFYKAHGVENYKTAVQEFQNSKDYFNKVNRYVKLEFPPYYNEYYNESKIKYLDELHSEAQIHLKNEKFEQADYLIDKILQIDPLYKDVINLKKTSEIEPIYQNGLQLFEAQNFKEAYNKFNDVLKIRPNYKNAIKFRKESLEKSVLTIALLPIEVNSIFPKESSRFYGEILEEIRKTKNIFIQLVDRANTEKLIAEQKLSLSGVINESNAIKAGELLGAKWIMTAKVIDFNINYGNIIDLEKKGYLGQKSRKYHSQGKYYYNATTYSKTFYNVSKGESQINATIEFQVISAESGEIVLSDVISKELKDVVAYATFEGDHKNLYSGTFKSKTFNSPSDEVYKSIAQKQELDKLLYSKNKKLMSKSALVEKLVSDMSKQIAIKIDSFEKDR